MFHQPLGDGAELRPLEPWQAAEFAAFLERARPDLVRWLPFADTIRDADAARVMLQDYADRQARDEGRLAGIWLDGVLVGGAVFRTFETVNRRCEMGVWLAPEGRGRGLVTRAARHMIDWAIRVRGMNRVEWRTAPENGASIAVARRLGMTREGVLRRAYPIGDAVADMEVWSMVDTDWAG